MENIRIQNEDSENEEIPRNGKKDEIFEEKQILGVWPNFVNFVTRSGLNLVTLSICDQVGCASRLECRATTPAIGTRKDQ